MPTQNGNGYRGGPSRRGSNPGSELEQLIGEGQERLKQLLPDGGSRTPIMLAVVRRACCRRLDRVLHGSE